MSEKNKAIVRRLMDEVWNQQNYAVLDEICSPNFQIYDPSGIGKIKGIVRRRKVGRGV